MLSFVFTDIIAFVTSMEKKVEDLYLEMVGWVWKDGWLVRYGGWSDKNGCSMVFVDLYIFCV